MVVFPTFRIKNCSEFVDEKRFGDSEEKILIILVGFQRDSSKSGPVKK